MKKLLIVIFSVGIASAAFARHGPVARTYYYHPRVIVGLGAYSPFYPYYGFGYSPFYPYPAYGYSRSSKMQVKIEDIKNDYHDKINSAKADKSLSHADRKATVKRLKQERDQAIDDLKKNYYKY